MICSVLVERLGDCSVINDSEEICEWRPLNSLLLFAQRISDQKTCCISSIDNKAKSIDSSFALMLEEVKKFAKSGSDDEIAGISKAFLSSIVCSPPDELLVAFPSVLTVSQNLLGLPLSLFSSVFFLEQTLLPSVSKFWPDIFYPGLNMVVNNCEGENGMACRSHDHTSSIGKVMYDQNVDANGAAPTTFSFFLKKAPFHVLFPAIMCIDGPYSLEPSKRQDLLLAKLSVCATDYHLIYMRLVLFWLYQIQSFHGVELSVELQQLSEICLILLDNLVSQLLVLETDSEMSRNHDDIQEVAETIFCHPAMITSLSVHFASVLMHYPNLYCGQLLLVSTWTFHRQSHWLIHMIMLCFFVNIPLNLWWKMLQSLCRGRCSKSCP